MKKTLGMYKNNQANNSICFNQLFLYYENEIAHFLDHIPPSHVGRALHRRLQTFRHLYSNFTYKL